MPEKWIHWPITTDCVKFASLRFIEQRKSFDINNTKLVQVVPVNIENAAAWTKEFSNMWQLQLLTLSYLVLGIFQPSLSFWNTYEPGQLLHRLNQLTDAIESTPMHSARYAASVPSTSTAVNTVVKRADNDVASSEYDYDRAYEQFVRQYFSDAASNAFSAEDSASEDEPSSFSAEQISEPLTEATRTHRRQQRCKKVRRNRQQCEVCRNPKTGEKSQTCSYYTETAPHEYSYERAKNYKKSRHSEDNSGEQDDAKSESYESNEGSNEFSEEAQPRNSASGECIRRTFGGKFCYTCTNSEGEKIENCTKQAKAARKRRKDIDDDDDGKRKSRKSQKEQRIYKRTISYSFENGNSTMAANSNATQPLRRPRLKKKVIIKVIKQKDALMK